MRWTYSSIPEPERWFVVSGPFAAALRVVWRFVLRFGFPALGPLPAVVLTPVDGFRDDSHLLRDPSGQSSSRSRLTIDHRCFLLGGGVLAPHSEVLRRHSDTAERLVFCRSRPSRTYWAISPGGSGRSVLSATDHGSSSFVLFQWVVASILQPARSAEIVVGRSEVTRFLRLRYRPSLRVSVYFVIHASPAAAASAGVSPSASGLSSPASMDLSAAFSSHPLRMHPRGDVEGDAFTADEPTAEAVRRDERDTRKRGISIIRSTVHRQ